MLIFSSQKLSGKFLSLIAAVLLVVLEKYCVCGIDFKMIEAPLVDDFFAESPFTKYLNVSEHPGRLCNRPCIKGDERVCHFDFHLEHYHAMGPACGNCAKGVLEDCNNPQCIIADGVEKGVMSINRQIPGPAIHVCQDDLVIVDVHNKAHGTAASIHWHGLHMLKTPFMDGVPFLTQCPISYSNSFRYHFYATQPGTQFYHSHSGHHKANGQFGPLIVRQPKATFSHLYEHDLPEHHIILNDWMHAYAEQHFPGLTNTSTSPDSLLINGRGQYTERTTGKQTKVPPTVYFVRPGHRYRFRVINSGNHVCPYSIQIEKHVLKVIATDSFDVFPFETDTLVTNSGERYDFVVDANQKGDNFFIRVTAMGICAARVIESFAVLRYATNDRARNFDIPKFPKYEETFVSNKVLNDPRADCMGEDNKHCAIELQSVEVDEELATVTPDYKFFLSFQNFPVKNQEVFVQDRYEHFAVVGANTTVMGTINKISLVFPDYPPLTQPDSIDESEFCDLYTKPSKCDGMPICTCTHRLKVKRNSVVEIIIVDETEGTNLISHPFHMHGCRFLVTGMGRDRSGLPMTVTRARYMDGRSMLPRYERNSRLPFKDTISIPGRGYAVIRIRATNPGFWLMHCHYDWHFSNGMGLILQVGETSEMVRPPRDFPKCGNYMPRVKMQSPDIFSKSSFDEYFKNFKNLNFI